MIRPVNLRARRPAQGVAVAAGPRRHAGRSPQPARAGRSSPPAESPFEIVDELVEEARSRAQIVLLDFHAEATSEKVAMARWLDGRVTAVVGTHTHVQTNDAPRAARRDGGDHRRGDDRPHDSVIGVDADPAIQRMRTGMAVRFRPAEETSGSKACWSNATETAGPRPA